MWWCAAPDPTDGLVAVLEAARELGFLGPGAVAPHLEHSRTFAALLDPPSGEFLDVGSGSGLPGLVLALQWPETRGLLLDSHQRRTAFLTEAITTLGLTDRLQVLTARAEDAARSPDLRAAFGLVVTRSFASPAVTAECAVGFLRVGGRLAVSEPPDPDPAVRWPSEGLAQLGLAGPEIRRQGRTTVAILTATRPVDDRWPRRTGIPAKRPLW